MIRVAIADDHPEMRVTLSLFVRLSEDIDLVCEARDGREAVDCVGRLQPDVLVMDIHMPVLNGFAATREISQLGAPTRVILISTYIGDIVARQAAAAGARGFVPKDYVPKHLLQAIEAVHRGETYFVTGSKL